jgi:hypothetical protein
MACGTLFFVMVALLAVGLDFFVTVFESWERPWYIVIPVRVMEIALYVTDLVLFSYFIIIEMVKMFNEIKESR